MSPQFFKLDVLYECVDGTLVVAPSTFIIEQLHNIIKMTSDPSTYPIGILTTDHRDTWTQSRERLIKGECLCGPGKIPNIIDNIKCTSSAMHKLMFLP